MVGKLHRRISRLRFTALKVSQCFQWKTHDTVLPPINVTYSIIVQSQFPNRISKVQFMVNITKLSYLILLAILSLYTIYHSLNDVAHNNVDFYGFTVFEYSNKKQHPK